MAQKNQVLLVKRAMVEEVIQAMETRTDKMAAQGVQAGGDGFYEQMMTKWKSLTSMTIEKGVAVIPLRGTITPDDPFAAYFGETSLVDFNANFAKAQADASVKSIVINAYTPGGYVYGVESAANTIYAARGKKPVYAFTDTLAASAGYWLISGASKIILGSETAEVGSIGVYLAHFDYSGYLDKQGIKVTEVTAGEFKGIGSPYSALSKEDEKLLQADVNYVYTRFVNAVARNRGMAVSDVLKSANGLTFYGTDAVKLGLADSIMTLQEVIQMAQTAEEKQKEQEQQTQAAQAKAEADAKALKAEQDKNAALAAELATYKAKEVSGAKDKLKAEANTAYKAAFGRDATAEEQETYASADEGARKMLSASLTEAATNRDKLAKLGKLTVETVTEGQEGEGSLSPLVAAAQRLGLAVVSTK
jgi:signal peptide peptidase SppA